MSTLDMQGPPDQGAAPTTASASSSTPNPQPTGSKHLQRALKRPFTVPTGQNCRVFISHARGQKWTWVGIVKEGFEREHPGLRERYRKKPVFVDETSLVGGQEEPIAEIYTNLADAFVVVVLLSEEFISKQYPMEELQLLMHWQSQHASPVKVLPVLYDITYDDIWNVIDYYKAAIDVIAGVKEHSQLPVLPERLSTVKRVVAGMVAAKKGEMLKQWVKDLAGLEINEEGQGKGEEVKGVLSITCLRRDQQAQWAPEVRDKVVARTVELLREMGEMPTHDLQDLPEVTVDLDRKTEQVVQRLEEAGSTKKRILLLHGMEGIGKTTLARKVYNMLHEQDPTVPCCFVELPAEVNDDKPRVEAQRQILEMLCHQQNPRVASVTQGLQRMREALEGRKVLLVVDNVWDEGLDLVLPSDVMCVLGKGSIVLVTSRDSNVTKAFEEHAESADSLTVGLLHEAQAMELLCRLAYGKNHETLARTMTGQQATQGLADTGFEQWVPNKLARRGPPEQLDPLRLVPPNEKEDVKALVMLLVGKLGALPFAVQVVGLRIKWFKNNDFKRKQYLLNASKALMEAYRDERAVRIDGKRTLFATLWLSWKALADEGKVELSEAQETLMDMASGLARTTRAGRQMVQAYCGDSVLEKVLRSGMVMVEGDELIVHDTISDFFAETQAVEWKLRAVLNTHEEEVQMVLKAEGSLNLLKGMLVRTKDVSVEQLRKVLSRQSNLQYLVAESAVSWSFASSVHYLFRWWWFLCGLGLKLDMWHLVPTLLLTTCAEGTSILHGIFNPPPTRHWQLKLPPALRWLQLRGGMALTGVGTNPPALQLVQDGSSCLRVLELAHVGSEVVDGLSNYMQLQVLVLHDLPCVKRLDLSGLPALEHLTLQESAALQSVSVLGLKCLQKMKLGSCLSLEALAGVKLAALQHVHVDNCPKLKIISLTDAARLMELKLHCRALPVLETLDLSGASSLTELRLVPPLPRLQTLNLSGASSLVELKLPNTTHPVRLETPGLSNASSVMPLGQLRGAFENPDLSDDMIAMTMEILHSGTFEIPDLSDDIISEPIGVPPDWGYPSFATLPGRFPDLSDTSSIMELSLGCLPQLQTLNLRGCRASALNVTGFRRTALELQGLATLHKLTVSACQLLQGVDVTGCTALRELKLLDCPGLRWVKGLDRVFPEASVTSLRSLTTHGADPMLGDLVKLALAALEQLELKGIRHLTALELQGLATLHTLTVSDDRTLQSVDITGCTSLRELKLLDCPSLRWVKGFDRVFPEAWQPTSVASLRSLAIRGTCPVLGDLMNLALSGLEELEVTGLRQTALELQGSTALHRLAVSWCKELQGVDITGCTALEGLTLLKCPGLQGVRGLDRVFSEELHPTSVSSLRRLTIDGAGPLLGDLMMMKVGALEELEVHGDWGKGTLHLQFVPALKVLRLVSCSNLQQMQLHTADKCWPLERLELVQCSQQVVSELPAELRLSVRGELMVKEWSTQLIGGGNPRTANA